MPEPQQDPQPEKPKQKTKKGLEIPVPKRDEFYGNLERTVKKRKPTA